MPDQISWAPEESIVDKIFADTIYNDSNTKSFLEYLKVQKVTHLDLSNNRAYGVSDASMITEALEDSNIQQVSINLQKPNDDFISSLRKAGVKTIVVNGHEIPNGMSLKALKRATKADMQKNGKIQDDNSSIANIIASQIFVDDPVSYFKEHLPGNLDELYQDTLMKTLMRLLAYASLGYHPCSTPAKKKKLKVFICIEMKKFQSLLPLKNSLNGAYTQKSSIFINVLDRYPSEILATVIHELMHFVLHEVYTYHGNPYKAGDRERESKCNEMIEQTRNRLKEMENVIETSSSDYPYEYHAFQNIKATFTYPIKEHAGEIIVRFTAVIAYLGVPYGPQWLKKFPELLDYFQNFVIPDIEQYLAKNDAISYLPLEEEKTHNIAIQEDPPFSEIMNALKVRDICGAKKIWGEAHASFFARYCSMSGITKFWK